MNFTSYEMYDLKNY